MAATPLLLPGNMCDARLWSRVEDGLAAQWGRPCRHADLTRDAAIAAMAERALRDHPGLLLPIGLSMGAIVAVEMAVLAPERIAGLVLAGYNATADLPERAAMRPVQQAAVRAGGLERVLVEELKPNYLAERNRGDRTLLDLLRDMGLALGPAVFVAQSEALRLRADRVADLARLACPVLYLAGAEDALCPPAWHERWAATTPGARLEIIDGSGHMLPLERPHAFARAVQHWAQEHHPA